MKRVRRWLFNAAAILSLLLFVAIVVICASDISARPHRLYNLSHRWAWTGAIQPAAMMVEIYHFFPAPLIGPGGGGGQTLSPAQLTWLKQFGVRIALSRGQFIAGKMPCDSVDPRGNLIMIGYSWWIGAPDWALFIAFAILPTFAWMRLRRQSKRPHQGFCTKCGYDLRATPNQCPECGTIPQKEESIST